MAVYSWTGNPWVDAGLAVILAKSGKEKIEALTDDDLDAVISDGAWLADTNRRLNAFTMVVGINSPLTNTSSNPSMKKKNRGILNPMDDPGFNQYCELIRALKESILTGSGEKFRCESCGERSATSVLAKYGKEIGRDWFPLAGSIGSDAQSLPAASRTARICSLCLLSIQFLPLGAVLLGGKLACFQSNYPELTQLIVQDIYEKTQDKLQSLRSNEKLSAFGQGSGSKEALIRIINVMRNLQRDKRILELPHQASINIWLFSNSGQEPDCDVVEIPNEALTFLWETARIETYRQEIESFLHSEPKRLDYQLMECIKRKSEYNAFYPYKSSKPASKGLFELYQTKVLGNQILSLKLAEWLSAQIKPRLSSGDKNDRNLLTKLMRENAYGNKDKTLMAKLKGLIAQFAEEGLIALEVYAALFPREEGNRGLLVKKDAFKWIWFYLNHEELADVKPEGGDILFTHPLIKTFAKDAFDYYLKERGLKYIKRNIIDEFKKGEVKTSDMQRWFTNLAEIKEGYTNEIWDDLCRDENGNNITYEVRFQLRLEMANLYRLANNMNGKE